MVDQENNGIVVADPFAPGHEDCSFDGLDRNPVVSNGVGKAEERPECGNLGIRSCTVEREMRNGAAEPIAMESTRVLKMDGEACESLGASGCNVEEGIGSISLAGRLQSSEQEMRNGAEPIAVESTPTVEVDGGVREKLGVSGCNSNIEEGEGSISLVSGAGSSVIIGKNDGKSEIKMDDDESESSESESDNPSSPTSASSSSSSDSDDSSTSGGSSDDDDSEEEEYQEEEKMTKKIEVEIEEGEIKDSDGQELGDDEDAREVSWSGINEEDDEDGTAMEGPIRSKNELKDLPSVPPVNVTIEPHHQMLPVGVVMSIISSQVVVEGMEKHDPLNEGSIVWITETRTPLGLVDEIFGPVKNPYYIVRYNSENEIPEGVHVGTSISFVPEFANHVLNNKDLYKKGYDASGLNDEELSDEAEFSDDEKEAEYRKMHKMKRGISDKNHGKHKNNNKKASRKNGPAAPPHPVPSASSTHNHEKFPPFFGIRPGPFEAASIVPPFPPASPGPNLASNGVWTNGISLMQRQTALLPNGFPSNGMSLFPGNAQNPYQLPVTGIPFQQHSGPNLGSLPLPGTSLPVVQPNIFAQPMYPQGLVGQNQMSFGMNFQQIQASVNGGGDQGFPPYGMQPGRNHNFQSGPGNNLHAPNQFRPGGSANRGRKTFHQRGRKGWRPTK